MVLVSVFIAVVPGVVSVAWDNNALYLLQCQAQNTNECKLFRALPKRVKGDEVESHGDRERRERNDADGG
jgi:hypothetical protein